VEGQASGTATYYFRTPGASGGGDSGTPWVSSSSSGGGADANVTTWEDPRDELELRLRFRSETLAAVVAPEAATASQQPSQEAVRAKKASMPSSQQPHLDLGFPQDEKPRFRRTTHGHTFRVERMPCDHSCGFHGLGIDRLEAARALLDKLGKDAEVKDLVAADLAAAMQTGERESFPPPIRKDALLWESLEAYYAAQQSLDEQRREALDYLSEEGNESTAAADIAAGGGRQSPEAVQLALQCLCDRLKIKVNATPSGTLKLGLMRHLGRGMTQLKEFQAKVGRSLQAAQSLKMQCHAKTDAYVHWVGSDHSFWLSFVRGCGGSDRAGGLLDALAKVFALTVRVWSETTSGDGGVHVGKALPDLELVHEATYGGRMVNLWYQGDRGHFDRLIPSSVP